MWRTRLSIHADYDAVETGDLWHNSSFSLQCSNVALRRNPYPLRYKGTFAFSAIPYPQSHRFTLR